MLPLAAFGGWFGYLLMVYGLSQVDGQRYTLRALAIPGWYQSGLKGDDGTARVGTTLPGPCTNKQIVAGWITNSQGQCVKGRTNTTSGYCRDNKTQKNMGPAKNGKCPKGQTYSTQLQE
jgi:hypothetical protein